MKQGRGTSIRLACVLALTAMLVFVFSPGHARAIDLTFSGSEQLDYFLALPQPVGSRPLTSGLYGFTNETAVKIAADLNAHISVNVKACVGCHGFELPMAFADLRIADELNIRVGRFTPTFGEYFLRADVGNHRTSDAPLPYDMGRMIRLWEFNLSVLPQPYVENGMEISGTHFFGNRVQLDYAAHLVTGLRSNAEQPYDVDFAASHSAFYIDNNLSPSYGGRVGANIRLADRVDFTMGVSASRGAYDQDAHYNYLLLGVDAFLRVGRTSLRAEYLLRQTEMAGGDQSRFEGVVPHEPDGSLAAIVPSVRDGWYVELEHPLNRVVDFVLRWDGLHRVGNVAPGSSIDFDAGISRWTLGANFVVYRGYRIKASVEHYYFWGLRNELPMAAGFHLAAVATF